MMMEGVAVKQLKTVPDKRGWLMELLRSDWKCFQNFEQTYVTSVYPQVVKAWHMHKKQTDNMSCIKGMVKLVLNDDREASNTKNRIDALFIGERNPALGVSI